MIGRSRYKCNHRVALDVRLTSQYLQQVGGAWKLLMLPASGSLRSTADDVLSFFAANLDYRLLPLKVADG